MVSVKNGVRDNCRPRYLQCLRLALVRFGCNLHAYVPNGNHMHLSLTPHVEYLALGADPEAWTVA